MPFGSTSFSITVLLAALQLSCDLALFFPISYAYTCCHATCVLSTVHEVGNKQHRYLNEHACVLPRTNSTSRCEYTCTKQNTNAYMLGQPEAWSQQVDC